MEITSNSCRTCLKPEGNEAFREISEIKWNQGVATFIFNDFLQISEIELKEQIAPHKICPQCYEILEISIGFFMRALESENIIENWMEKQGHSKSECAKISCFYCAETFESEKTLEEHLNNQHIEDPFHESFNENEDCPMDVNKSVEGSELEASKEEATNFNSLIVRTPSIKLTPTVEANSVDVPEFFVCNFCSKIFKYFGYLRAHMRFHSEDPNKGEGDLVMNSHQETFSLKNLGTQSLKDHNYFATPRGTFASEFQPEFINYCNNVVPDEFGNYSCNFCPEKYKSKGGLEIHMKNHLKIPLKKEEIEINQILTSIRPNGLGRYWCPKCNTEVSTKTTLKRHLMAKHFNLRPFNCEFCDKSYVSRGTLQKHQKSAHSKGNFNKQKIQVNEELEKKLNKSESTLESDLDISDSDADAEASV